MFEGNKVETILKKKNKALSVFENTKSQLLKLAEELKAEIEKGQKRMADLISKIEKEQQRIELAKKEINSSLGTVERINDLIQ